MANKFVHLLDDEAVVLEAAEELTTAQLAKAKEIVLAAMSQDSRFPGDMHRFKIDGSLLGGVVQALATNQLSLVLARRNFTE